MKPFLSICIPTYNRSKELNDCLNSIVSQNANEKDFEIIISDNDSKDNTKNIVSYYQNKSKNIFYYKNETNIGPERNFRLSINRAKGEYVWVLGDDDQITKDSINHVLNILKSNDISLLILNFSILSKDFTTTLIPKYHPYRSFDSEDYNSVLKKFTGTIGLISALVLKRSYFESLPFEKYDKFIQYGLSYMFAAYYVAMKPGVIVYSEKPIVLNRSENSPIESIWVKYFIEGVSLLFDELFFIGYKNSNKSNIKNKYLIQIILPYLLWRMRNTGKIDDVKAITKKYYSSCFTYWLLFMPINLIPYQLLQNSRKFYRFFYPREKNL